MKKSDLKKRTRQILRNNYKEMLDKIDRAILSGSMNIDGAADNYELPRKLAVAILKDAYTSNEGWAIEVKGKKVKREINNIYIQL